MSSSLITRSKDFNSSSVTYGAPSTNKHGGKSVPILVDGSKLVLQFPLNFTWGAQANTDEASGRTSYSCNLVLDEDSPFRTALTELQEKVLDDMVTNSKAWFGKAIASREVIEALSYNIVRYPNIKGTSEPDTSRKPSVKASLPEWDGVFKTELFNMAKQPLNGPTIKLGEDDFLAAIPIGSHISGLLECKGIWYSAGRCGVTWKLVQARVKPPVRLEGYCMVDDSDDEDDIAAIDASAAAAAAELDASTAGLDNVVDSDNEIVEAAPEPVVEKPKKKKRAVKKATVAAAN
tara:strand:+ start:2169 stop:3041 length:873 start_codon:yes stop_codon:yes gene_type:complete